MIIKPGYPSKMVHALICCWRCKKFAIALRKCQNDIDYICSECQQWVGLKGPEIGNKSKIYYDKSK